MCGACVSPKVENKGEKPEHPWFEPLEIRWIDAEGMVRYRGGGQAVRPGAIWERYLGSALPPGSYTVSVRVRHGPLLAQRSFEVLPEDPSAMEPAERLRLLPQYFDLLDEPEHAGDEGTPTAQLTGTSHNTRNAATTSTTTATATSTTASTSREPKMPRKAAVSSRQAPEPGKPKAVEASGSVFRPGAKDREWLRKDLPLDTAGDENSRIPKLECPQASVVDASSYCLLAASVIPNSATGCTASGCTKEPCHPDKDFLDS